MKNIKSFFLSFFASLVLFFIAAFICIILSSVNSINSSPQESAPDKKASQNPEAKFNILTIYQNENQTFISTLEINCESGVVLAKTISPDQKVDGLTFKENYILNGVYSLTSAVEKQYNLPNLKYIVLNQRTFEIITDRTGVIVYNDINGEEILLTSVQITENISPELFTIALGQIAENSLGDNIVDNFNFVVNLCENNFSYPSLLKGLAND